MPHPNAKPRSALRVDADCVLCCSTILQVVVDSEDVLSSVGGAQGM